MKALSVVALTLCVAVVSVHAQSNIVNRLLSDIGRGGGGSRGSQNGFNLRSIIGNNRGRGRGRGRVDGNIFGGGQSDLFDSRGDNFEGRRRNSFFDGGSGRGGRGGFSGFGGFGSFGRGDRVSEVEERNGERRFFEEQERERDDFGQNLGFLNREALEDESQSESRFRGNDDTQFGLREEGQDFTDLDVETLERARNKFALQVEEENDSESGNRLSFNEGEQDNREVIFQRDFDQEEEAVEGNREAEESETEFQSEVIQESESERQEREEEEQESLFAESESD